MLVKIRSSRLFDTSPAIRFANQYSVPENMWTEMWKRHKMLEFTLSELQEYFLIKTGKKIRKRQITRWIFLTDIYSRTKPAREKGAEVIDTSMFGEFEDKVIEELTRHLKSGSTKRVNVLV